MAKIFPGIVYDGEGGGGGGAPGGLNTQLQFNDGGVFGGDAGLVYNKTLNELTLTGAGTAQSPTLFLGDDTDGNVEIEATGIAVQLTIRAAAGDETHVGGEVNLVSGNSAGQGGGNLTIAAGGDSADGDGGGLTLRGGEANEGAGGEVAITGGPAEGASGDGGQVIITGGGVISPSGDDGGTVTISGGGTAGGAGAAAGSVEIYAGNAEDVAATDGVVLLSSSTGAMTLQVDNTGITFGGLPTSNPGAGYLWSDGGTVKVGT